MTTLAQKEIEALYCLFKGEPGTRKSTCALSFPRPQYWISWDQKMDALYLPMLNWNVDPREVTYDDFSDWNKVEVKLKQLQTSCPFKTLVIDSITSGSDAINRQTLATKRGNSEGKLIAGIPVNSIEDFNAEDSRLKELVAITKDIYTYWKVNVILIAHVIQKEVKSSDGKTHMARTLVTAGKGIAQKIPAYCSEVYHFNIKTGIDTSKGGQYSLLTTHTGDDFARSSLPLESEIIFGSDPLYDKWVKPAVDKINARIRAVKQSQQSQPTTQQPTTSKFTT